MTRDQAYKTYEHFVIRSAPELKYNDITAYLENKVTQERMFKLIQEMFHHEPKSK